MSHTENGSYCSNVNSHPVVFVLIELCAAGQSHMGAALKPVAGPWVQIMLGGHSWLISLLILGHMLAVMAFWIWLFYKQGSSGKKRKSRRKAPEMHIKYAFAESAGSKGCLA